MKEGLVVQQTTSGGTPLKFRPEEHTDFVFVVVPEEISWLVAGVVFIAGAGILWWRRRRRAHQTG